MFQPGSDFHKFKLKYALEENEAVIAADTLPDLFARLGHAGNLLQLDPDHTPTAYKCGTVTPAELDSLRKIETVIRLGHSWSQENQKRTNSCFRPIPLQPYKSGHKTHPVDYRETRSVRTKPTAYTETFFELFSFVTKKPAQGASGGNTAIDSPDTTAIRLPGRNYFRSFTGLDED